MCVVYIESVGLRLLAWREIISPQRVHQDRERNQIVVHTHTHTLRVNRLRRTSFGECMCGTVVRAR